jgi:hypothetical protein
MKQLTKEQALAMVDTWWEKYDDVPEENHMVHTLCGFGMDLRYESIVAMIEAEENLLFETDNELAMALNHRLLIRRPGRPGLLVATKKESEP